MDNPPLPTRIRHTSHHTNPSSNFPSTRTSTRSATLPHPAIQGIDALQTGVSQLNDYVDSRTFPSTIAAVHQSTGSATSQHTAASHKHTDLCKNKVEGSSSTRELTDNLRNESRERTISSRALPPLPPRTYKPPQTHAPPPPLPRRMRGLETEVPPPISRKNKPTNTRSNHNSNRVCVPRSVRTNLQPAAVLIVDTSEPSRHKTSGIRATKELSAAITKQPTSNSTKRELTTKLDRQTGTLTNSIICSECGHCKCSSCSDDRPLPETWLCDGNCRCAVEPVVDIASCMCVVKGLYSQCDNQNHSHPCACTPAPNCCGRWTGLALLSLCFPCLCCFLPLKAGAAATKACYNSSCCRKRGCRCDSVR